ncbi:DUF3106 domain-containing protein [Ideonella sp. 4Y16]|uniref:DUF3106 domain-containing protein n=1 Tax=Ideonella alba TaxID=2824118 RepID=A0A940YAL7_9BURK|nr:DUF3106 domain-containing protein [Ideonella alba]MBQ0931978.1 DUF3106 domain-containing protein [Ideonella alba]MBQ0942513.1 DUF3106 domain-containing protein [Ideonella alba]
MPRSRSLTPVAWLSPLLLAIILVGAPVAQAQVLSPSPDWASLQASQQKVLAPLKSDWNSLDATQRQKWLELATRYPSMSADQQQRMQQRMSEWARMTPSQRGQARINFQQARTIPAPDRQAQWEAYQALPPERKQALAQRQAAPASAPQTTAAGQLRRAPVDALAAKANSVTPTPAPAPRAVGPSLVQAGPGATTRLITQAPPVKPAASAPRPKIEVNPQMVDRTTLLPKPLPPKPPAAPKAPKLADATPPPPAEQAPASAP